MDDRLTRLVLIGEVHDLGDTAGVRLTEERRLKGLPHEIACIDLPRIESTSDDVRPDTEEVEALDRANDGTMSRSILLKWHDGIVRRRRGEHGVALIAGRGPIGILSVFVSADSGQTIGALAHIDPAREVEALAGSEYALLVLAIDEAALLARDGVITRSESHGKSHEGK